MELPLILALIRHPRSTEFPKSLRKFELNHASGTHLMSNLQKLYLIYAVFVTIVNSNSS